QLRTIIDLRECNKNTKKLSSPLLDIKSVLRRVASKKYKLLINSKDMYEQIRIIPEHVNRLIFNTLDGTMVSEVMQLGDCNSRATYQALMNYIFQPYLGDWMDIYLDDLVIYSDTIEDHMQHLRTVIDILHKEKFYLSKHKMQLFQKELKILDH
ncbi:DNA/RNA polymerase, partial [Fomitiporia mediterranea MF3/22]